MEEHLFLVNNDLTYTPSAYVKKNVYLTMEAEKADLPTLADALPYLPKPFWDGHDDAIACHDYAWTLAFKNLKKANAETGFVSNFADTAFNDFLFMWDSSFILMFGKYASRIFNFQKTLDNFYSHQHMDGYICREICQKEPGEHFARHDPSSTGPNVMPWSEWESYCQTGDVDRLARIFDPLLAYHLWLKEYRTWPDGSYWNTGWGCGMDNQPRLEEKYDRGFSHGHMVWLDTCVQMVLSAKILVKISEILGRQDDPGILELKEEIELLTKVINEKLWCEDDAFYYDLYRNGKFNYVKSVGAYWALIADIIPEDRLERFVSHLDNPNEFKRPCRVPTLSADHPSYREDGDYWCGSIWAPTNYMVLKGLEKNGYNSLAYDIGKNCLENVVEVFNKTETIWENYAPETANRGSTSKSKFIGWSGLFPISIMFEYVFGIRAQSREKKIVWYVNLTERHGINNYPLGSIGVDLICEKRNSVDEEPEITVKSPEKIEVEIHWGDKTKTIYSE